MRARAKRVTVAVAVVTVPLVWAGGAIASPPVSGPPPVGSAPASGVVQSPVGKGSSTTSPVPAPATRASATSSVTPGAAAPSATTPMSTSAPASAPDASPTSSATPTSASLTSAGPSAATVAPQARKGVAASVSVGSHVAGVVDRSVLGAPVAAEGHWSSAGGGWAQRFENGWALVSDAGQGGMVTGPLLSYFTAHGYVSATGWPTGDAVHDAQGTYQKFSSAGRSIWGALATTPSGGVVRIGMGMYDNYFGHGLRPVVGAPLGEEFDSWKAGGGGHAQNFQRGWVTYKWSKAMGWFPHDFTFAQLDFDKKGWPTSGAYGACGALKVNQANGYTATGNRWCPASNLAQPTTSIAAAAMPSSLTSASGGDAGINVMLVQRKLGISSSSFNGALERIAGSTATKVAQKRASYGGGYSATIDPWLWNKLGITVPWALGMTPQQPALPLSATAQQRVNAMITFAQSKTKANGYPYTYGSAGPNASSRGSEKYGYDCSGLVLAAMQYAGIKPRTASVRDDIVHPTKLTRALYSDSSLRHEALSSRKPGDLIYYTTNGSSTGIAHVALYLGGNKVFDTENNGYEGKVRTLWEPSVAGLSLFNTVSRPVA